MADGGFFLYKNISSQIALIIRIQNATYSDKTFIYRNYLLR